MTVLVGVSPPKILYFKVNDKSETEISPGEPLTFTWDTENTDNVEIVKVLTLVYSYEEDDGSITEVFEQDELPDILPQPLRTPTGDFTLSSVAGSFKWDTTYEIKATSAEWPNGSRYGSHRVLVKMQFIPQMAIHRIEVVQAIQRDDNSVRLVSNKRAIARVFVDSGLTNGFENCKKVRGRNTVSGWESTRHSYGGGQGPNSQPRVTGRLQLQRDGMTVASFISPFNNTGFMTAMNPHDINRDLLNHSLNFELPLYELLNVVTIGVDIWVSESNNVGPAHSASGSVEVIFNNQPSQEILPILIKDSHLNLPRPDITMFGNALQGARTRFPVAENGFIVNPPINVDTGWDLTTDHGWNMLIFELSTMIFLVPSTPVGGIRCGLLPQGPYKWGGMGTPRIAVSIPTFASSSNPVVFAHEMTHTFGINHAACPHTGNPHPPKPPIDNRLPTTTSDFGIDVFTRRAYRSGLSELMSYCPEPTWISIESWDIIFDRLPI